MIEIDFYVTSGDEGGSLSGFAITGHSGFAEEGEDIVCSAVSSAAYMAVNTITDVLHVTPLTLIAEDGDMRLRLERADVKAARDILSGLKMHMVNLEEQYSSYIRVGYVEV